MRREDDDDDDDPYSKRWICQYCVDSVNVMRELILAICTKSAREAQQNLSKPRTNAV